MPPRDLFAVGVRLFGVWLLTVGTNWVACYADGKLYPGSGRVQDSAAGYLIYAAFDFTLAAFFLLWTRVIVAWTYGEDRRGANETPAGPGSEAERPA